MVIHHDKMAYGRLGSLTEKLSDEKLAKMAQLLSREEDDEKTADGRNDCAQSAPSVAPGEKKRK